jgi:hypothetical protein
VPEVAAGFLYRTDSKLGFFDGFVGNPLASKREVRAALRELLRELAEDAKGWGMSVVYGYTKYFSIAEIAVELGGVAAGDRFFALAKEL